MEVEDTGAEAMGVEMVDTVATVAISAALGK